MPATAPRRPGDLDRAVQGDRDAWKQLLREHGPRIYGLCSRLTDDPDDAYQEIWARVFQNLARFDPNGPAALSTWIATIAIRHLIDRHRKAKVRGEVLELPDLASEGTPVDVSLSERERVHHLERALERIPDSHRRVVVAHHLEGMSLDDLANAEGVAVGTIKSRLHRGRARLLQLLRSV